MSRLSNVLSPVAIISSVDNDFNLKKLFEVIIKLVKLSYYRIFMIICNSILNVKLSWCLLDDVFVVLWVSTVFLIVRRSLFHRFSEHSSLLPRSRHDTLVEFPERKTWSFRPALKKWTTRTIENMIETRRTTSTLHHHSAIIISMKCISMVVHYWLTYNSNDEMLQLLPVLDRGVGWVL